MKTDLRKSLPTYAAKHGEFSIITVPPLRYLMLDGHGDPNEAADYERAITTIYPFAYNLKFLSKRVLDHDYVVPPLEALWWAEDLSAFTDSRDKTTWDWTLLSLVPEWIGDDHLAEARATVTRKGGAPGLHDLRAETLDEGTCVQTLHVGPYEMEGPVIAALHDFAAAEGFDLTGKHHEIYLSDPRRVAPEKLRTILRQPVAHR
ncbi:hypothetical protein AFL01nite_26980 [Aeromicrobium flavum]|uniref:GyrI-like small molecule binding domain-containing protein n=1 Tax=Aeromicrobium flavum TaxID=416568 RepID=A0A512HY49_9ACTN|nr:GyrI-like domain-containing protein [Aeromicrobium flavum]GEO90371.1 hypothetical protein AFL01nite_26980 [Aeromicrobium flavum]